MINLWRNDKTKEFEVGAVNCGIIGGKLMEDQGYFSKSVCTASTQPKKYFVTCFLGNTAFSSKSSICQSCVFWGGTF